MKTNKIFILIILSMMILAAGSLWATTWTVGTSGDYITIQAAISAATTLDGDILQIDAGTYTEALTVGKSLTFIGSGPASNPTTIITSTASRVIQLTVTGKSFTFQNLIVEGNVTNNGIYAGSTIDINSLTMQDVIVRNCQVALYLSEKWPETTTVSNLSMDNVTLTNNKFIGAYIGKTVLSGTVANCTVTDNGYSDELPAAWQKTGLQFVNFDEATVPHVVVTNSTFSNNGAGASDIERTGLIIYTAYNALSGNEIMTVSGCSFSNHPLYAVRIKNGYNVGNTATVNGTFTNNFLDIWFNNIIGTTSSTTLVRNTFEGIKTVGVGPTYDYNTIQAAIDAASSGNEIQVTAGTYTEQLHITTENLTITGSDVDDVFIQSPITLTDYFTTGTNNNFPIIFVDGVDDFSISDVTVDGNNQGDTNYRFVGLGFWNSGGSYTNGKVINMMNSTFSGAQHGTGIYAYNDTDGPYNIILNNVDVYDFQKTAIALSGVGLTVDIDNVSTIGEGPTAVTAQNGIQIGWGASGTVDDCVISEIAYTGATWTASGMLVYNGISVVANNVDIDNCQTSVYYQDAGGSFSNGTITDCLGDALYLYAYADVRSNFDKPKAQPLFDEYETNPSREDVTLNLTNTVITGVNIADSWGPSVIAYPGFTGNLNIQNCTITNWDYGIVCYEAGGTAQLTANENQILNNISYGYYSNAVLEQDATSNWWGDLDPTDDVSANVDYSPWLGDVPGTSPMTWYTNDSIQDAIDAASAGDEINVAAGTYFEVGQIVIDKNLTITGAGETATILKPDYSTTGGSYSTTSAWIYVQPGVTFNLYDVTLDGRDLSDNLQHIQQAIQSRGELTVERCKVQYIHASIYDGRGIVTLAGASNYINDVNMNNIQRIGIHIRGGIEPTNPVTNVENFTYLGKGALDCLDYGIEFGGGGQGVVGDILTPLSGCNITNCYGIASSDGSTSAGILITDYYGTGTIAEVYSSVLTSNSDGIVVGYDTPDISVLTAHNNQIFGNTDYGIFATENTVVDATDNWWGDLAGPTPPGSRYGNAVSPGVIYEPWWIDEGMTVRSSEVDIYVDAIDELIKDEWSQNYSLKIAEIVDLRGFEVYVNYPKAYFDEASNFVIGSEFSANGFTLLYDELIYDDHVWKYKITGSYLGGAAGVFGTDVVLFTFDMASLEDADNVALDPLYSVIDIGNVELKDDNDPYNVIPYDETIGKTIIVDAGEPTMTHNNAATYPSGMILSVLGDGSRLLDRPTLNFTFTDNYDLDDVQYLVQDEASAAPTLPAAFPLDYIVGDFAGTTTTEDWQLPAALDALADGTYTIYYLVLDDAGNFSIYDWDFIKDTTAPGAVTWVQCRTTIDANNSIDLEWTNPAGAVKNHIWALDYDEIDDATGYPEYDPATIYAIPSAPDPYNSATQSGWTQIAVINAPASYPYVWDSMLRGYYYITIFAEDASGNISIAPEAPFHRESISYWLGDVDATPDGDVDVSDIALLSGVWGLADGDPSWNNVIDVGPTTDNGRRSRPTPDNVIDIEDLMIFAMNYENTDYTVYRSDDSSEPVPIGIELEYEQIENEIVATLTLLQNSGFVKGLNIPVRFGSGLELVSVETSEIWPQGSFFNYINENNVVEISASVLGGNCCLEDNGLVATIHFQITGSRTDLNLEHMTARTVSNDDIEIIDNPELTGNDNALVIPNKDVLGANYPNPFNPTTTINYDLKEETKVSITLYNVRGQKIRTLINQTMPAGQHQVIWDGNDKHGRRVASGIYFYKMDTKDYTDIRRATLLK